MKKKLLLLTLFVSTTIFSQTSMYEHPEFDAIAKTHKTIAILPFETTVKLRPKQMEKTTPAQVKELELSESRNIQRSMFSWFLKRKTKGNMTVEVQDPTKTTSILLRKKISTKNMGKYTPDQLARILGVDAVISGTYETSQPMSNGASIALGVLGLFGATNSSVINMSVHNRKDGVLLWNYNKKVRGSVGSSSDDLINVLMRKASRRLAYTNKK